MNEVIALPRVPTVAQSDSIRPALLCAVVLASLAGVIALTRMHTFHEPLDRDLHGYAVMAHEFLRGRALYADVWDHKPPLIALTYALAELLVGYGPASIYVLGVAAAWLTLFGVFFAARGAMGSHRAGLCAALFWTCVCSSLTLQANQPNTEVFINTCLVWAFTLQTRRNWSHRTALAVGLLIAVGSLYKHVVLVAAFGFSVAHILLPPQDYGRRRAFIDAIIVGTTALTLWLLVFAAFLTTGHFTAFWEAVVSYNRSYAGSLTGNLRTLLHTASLFPGYVTFAFPLFCLSWLAIGLMYRTLPRLTLLYGAWSCAILLMIVLPGKDHPHYYQLWLPWLAIGGGWAVDSLWTHGSRTQRLLGPLVAIFVLAILVREQRACFRLPADEWSRMKYGDVFVDSARIGKEISSLLRNDETFFEWGAETGLYFATGCQPPSRFFYFYPLLSGHALSHKFCEEALEDLKNSQPELLVIWKIYEPLGQDHPVYAWCLQNYRPLPAGPDRGPCTFFARRGGALEARLSLTASANPPVP